jgi:hypothetical protein
LARLEFLGAWRSLVARTVRVGEVPGSNPGAPIVRQTARVVIGQVDMVRLKMDNGPNVVIQASAAEVHRAFQAALDSNEPMKVQTPDGVLAVNPHRVLYMEEGSARPENPVVFATLEVTL